LYPPERQGVDGVSISTIRRLRGSGASVERSRASAFGNVGEVLTRRPDEDVGAWQILLIEGDPKRSPMVLSGRFDNGIGLFFGHSSEPSGRVLHPWVHHDLGPESFRCERARGLLARPDWHVDSVATYVRLG
jgi:hypothetical protein